MSASTGIISPLNSKELPAERGDASSLNEVIGKFRRSNTLKNSFPTAPVAPTMAKRLGLLAGNGDESAKEDGICINF
ncbi:MAG: hypothetical protein ACH346_06435 [Chthoniobacterales bacterium]